MSIEALKDAFIAGWYARAGLPSRPEGIDAHDAFNEWWLKTLRAMDRKPLNQSGTDEFEGII